MLTAAARDDVDRQDLDPYVRDRQTRRPPDRVERLRSRMLRMALYRHTQTGALPHGVGRTKNDAGRLVLRTIEQAVRRSSEKAGTSIPEPCSHDLYVSVPVHSVLMRSISRSCKREGWDRTTNSARIGHLPMLPLGFPRNLTLTLHRRMTGPRPSQAFPRPPPGLSTLIA